MGGENEDFIGNPNKIEYTDDELEFEYYETGEIDLIDELDDQSFVPNLLGDFLHSDDEEDDSWYDDMDDVDDDDEDHDDEDDFEDHDDTDSYYDGMLNFFRRPSEPEESAEAPSEANANTDNNETVVKTTEEASTAPPSDSVENPPS